MANTSLETLLSIEEFREIMGLDPYHFHGITSASHPVGNCDRFWCQESWMSDTEGASREGLARAIDDAERQIAKYLGYWMAPRYTQAENLMLPQYFRTDVYRETLIDARGRGIAVKLDHGYFIEGGQETLDLVAADVAVSYVGDWGTLATVSYPAGSACEVKVFHAGETDEALRIRPLDVTLSGGNLNIRARKWLFADPDLWLESCTEIDGDDADSFVSEVDVYRAYADSETQAQFHWEPATGCDGTTACGCTIQSACLAARDFRLSEVVPVPATYSDGSFVLTSLEFSRQPDRVRVWYRSGLPWEECRLNRDWARTAAYLAVVLLDRETCMCACDKAMKFLQFWNEPYAQNAEGTIVMMPDMDNPLGFQRGAVHAWKKIKEPGAALGSGILL